MIETKLINLFAGPGGGKTTVATGIFHWMKEERMNVEYAPEYAKDIVWDETFNLLDDQLSVFCQQHRRFYRLYKSVEYIITDSPLLLSLVYGKNAMKKYDDTWKDSFHRLVRDFHYQYANYNYFVERGDRKYIQEGRTQDYESAKEKDLEIKNMLTVNKINYKSVVSYEDVLRDLTLIG